MPIIFEFCNILVTGIFLNQELKHILSNQSLFPKMESRLVTNLVGIQAIQFASEKRHITLLFLF